MSKALLKRKDINGVVIERWGNKLSKTQIYCSLYSKAISFDHGGINQINQHAKSDKHSDIYKARFSIS